MTNNEQLFTELTPKEGANISGGQSKNSTGINLKLPDSYTLPERSSIKFNPPPPKKSKKPKNHEIDKDCQCLFPGGGNVGIYGDFERGIPILGGVIRF